MVVADALWSNERALAGESLAPNSVAADAFAYRLHNLNDEQWVKHTLGAALEEMAGSPVKVATFQIEHCHVSPERSINVALSVGLRTHPFGEPVPRRLSCTMWPSVETARQQFDIEARRLEPTFADASRELRGFARLMVLLPHLAMVVRLFPVDPELVGLLPATNVTDILPLLDSHLHACRGEGWHARDLQSEVVDYKPGRVCTLRYEVGLSRPFAPDTRTQEVYGFVYRDDQWRSSFAFQHACWEAASRSDGVWRTARPIAALPAWRSSLQEAVSGRRFDHVLDELTGNDVSEADVSQAEDHLWAVARAIRSLQRAPILLGPRCDVGSLLASLERNLPYLQRSEPALADELTRLARELVLLEATIPAMRLGPAHGSFSHDNVLIDEDDDGVGIVDFDRAGQAEPVRDVAHFLTHFCLFGIRHPERRHHARRLGETFRAAYLEVAPEVSSARLSLYEALDLTSEVVRTFREQGHQAHCLPWAQGLTEAAWSRLRQAGTDAGSLS